LKFKRGKLRLGIASGIGVSRVHRASSWKELTGPVGDRTRDGAGLCGRVPIVGSAVILGKT
jgi:hypothetical protein